MLRWKTVSSRFLVGVNRHQAKICARRSQQDIEKAPAERPPAFDVPASKNESPLRKLIALQHDALLVLGPRRIPPLTCPAASTSTSVSIVTSFGFRMLECGEYIEAIQALRPDIALAMGDVLFGLDPGVKRQERMGDRTQSWLNAIIAGLRDPNDGAPNTSIFAAVLPIEPEKQSWYLTALRDDFRNQIGGLVLYDVESVSYIPEGLSQLPRLSLADLRTPHQLLDAIEAGLDVCTLPFANQCADDGFALDFCFGRSDEAPAPREPKPLALDLWSDAYATDLLPLRRGCQCYSCQNHHRAYIRHLLNAGEMLSWVLLQIHNYHVLDEFFLAIRESITRGDFEKDKATFSTTHRRDWPDKTGQGPR